MFLASPWASLGYLGSSWIILGLLHLNNPGHLHHRSFTNIPVQPASSRRRRRSASHSQAIGTCQKKDEEVVCVQVCIFQVWTTLVRIVFRLLNWLVLVLYLLISCWSNPLCNINNTEKTSLALLPRFSQSSVAPTIVSRDETISKDNFQDYFSIPFWQNANAPRIRSVLSAPLSSPPSPPVPVPDVASSGARIDYIS